MGSNLQLHQERLKIPIGVIQHASVQGIFEVITSQGKERSREAASALQACLGYDSQVRQTLNGDYIWSSGMEL